MNEKARGAPRFYSRGSASAKRLLGSSVSGNRGGPRSYSPKRSNSKTFKAINEAEQGRPGARGPTLTYL